MKKLLHLLNQHKNKISIAILALTSVLYTAYSFLLAYKRYVNFEYGKFDLGNMAQIVWNTSQGRFMEVTDQFGMNMPRWGMSHFDPILLIFVPIYTFIPNPMLLVLGQHILIVSAVFPIFLLVRKFLKSNLIALIVCFTYLIYPAIGFSLAWTGYHGISFVAPLLIWFFWLLEKYNYFTEQSNLVLKITYWVLIIFMLAGKEEVGAILALVSIFIYLKNKKLGLVTFFVSISWFIFAFFILIPSSDHYREESINTFLSHLAIDNVDSEDVSGDNFFLHRYSYLGDSYSEMVVTVITDPVMVVKEVFSDGKAESLNNLFGPLGYITILSPIWLVSTPDLAIVLLSKDAIFEISNHRIAFVISSLFLAYIYLLKFLFNKLERNKMNGFLILAIFTIAIFITSIYFSEKVQNPIYISGKSLVTNKIIAKVIAQTERDEIRDVEVFGDTRKSKIPKNNNDCANDFVEIIHDENPEIYTGPDYLGAHSANRRVNALFPSRYWDSDLIIADIFDAKVLGPFGDKGWTFNKVGLRNMYNQGVEHIYSCGQVSVFIPGETTDTIELIDSYEGDLYDLEFKDIKVKINITEKPESLDFDSRSNGSIKLVINKSKGSLHDDIAYFKFRNKEDEDQKVSFIDYMSIADKNSLDGVPYNNYIIESYKPIIKRDNLNQGTYKIYYGIGNLLESQEIYLGDIEIK